MRPEPSAAPEVETLIVGRVLGSHGVRGFVRIEPLTDDPGRFASLEQVIVEGRPYAVSAARVNPGRILLKLEGVDTPEAARALRNEYLHVPFDAAAPLPEGAYYHFQLVGLRVETKGGEPLGTLAEVLALPANDVYVVRGDRGELLIPAVRDIVTEIDLDARRMVIDPLPGLLPEKPEAGEEGDGDLSAVDAETAQRAR